MPDPTTQSNYLAIASQHVDLVWELDWTKKAITGHATHSAIVNEDGVQEFIVDTLFLDIHKVEVEGESAPFTVGKHHEVMGSPLRISLKHPQSAGTKLSIRIVYETTKDCTALQWLDKEQTAGRLFPYLFSQCQPIHARSLVPLQDSPSVKITWAASVTSVLPVLLSAIRVSPPSTGPAHDGKEIGKESVVYTYKQPVPIPSYLIAIASGNVRYKPFETVPGKDWTTGVWAEPEVIDAAHWEFCEDTPKFMIEAEKLAIPYKFGVYEMVVLPPSFPYGGMENACLTFLTPTLLSGDRALVDVVAHELQHSWFGNGVTQADSSHFWLNEGWTTYMERMLLRVLHGQEERDFSFLMDFKSLQDSLKQYEDRPKYQRLVIDFEYGEDPDDAYSKIPYEKGSNFIYYLERSLGGPEVFLPYVKDYVSTYIGKSINTFQWKDHLFSYFKQHNPSLVADVLDKIDWNAWFYGEGLKLPEEYAFDTTLAEEAFALAARWDTSRLVADPSTVGFQKSDVEAFNTNQKIVFLERLQVLAPLPKAHIDLLGDVYGFRSTLNVELRFRYYELALASPAGPSIKEEVAEWVVDEKFESGGVKGRMKFCRPTFRGLKKVDEGLAKKTFESSRERFHPIARRLIQKDLGLI
ncbi:leukotriene-A4 hydrolase [Sistotremastrum niveocremeum HHB9708]|uniref:Leukotriene-A4 hydrolase n=1 Tax=Sistotremastrum niveocremeum HHB9708 TaxID=1314777 RepID=A0A164R4B0_9AGAM|nr:leukotriene-A4 hydrolase [Sistotremastrum niveocremeum HHB9708]